MKLLQLNDFKRQLCNDYVTGGCDYCVAYNKALKMCFFDIRKVYEEMKDKPLYIVEERKDKNEIDKMMEKEIEVEE